MSDTITIKLTRAVKAASKRLLRFERFMNDESRHDPYAGKRTCARADDELLSAAVLAAIKKGGAGCT